MAWHGMGWDGALRRFLVPGGVRGMGVGVGVVGLSRGRLAVLAGLLCLLSGGIVE